MSNPVSDPRTDEELLRAHVAGDPQAFGELFGRHQDRLWAVALRTTRDPEEASDALQDAMISAFRRAETFRGNSKVSTWLHRIVVNACLDRMRSRRSRPTVPMSDHSEVLTPDPRDPIAEHETAMAVHGALAKLTVDQRAAVVLVDLEGWSVEGAAEILGCPPGTVKSRCHRGRTKLAQLLGNPDPAGPVTTTDLDDSRSGNTPRAGRTSHDA
jgi:RNA polymerase sigma-70 factor (ECF subfamily)